MPFNIIRNDITKLEVDAIVNAANTRLLAGGGVCGAIFAAAGKEQLQKECNKIGFCGTGEAVITKGFNLPAKFVIHTAGPIYGNDPKNEDTQLYSCYKNSLEIAKKKRLSSIAFPVISSGIYGYPSSEAIKIATRAIRDFLESNEMTVYLVVYDRNTFLISEKIFSEVESFIDDRMVSPNIRVRRGKNANFTECFDDELYSRELSQRCESIFPESVPMYQPYEEHKNKAPNFGIPEPYTHSYDESAYRVDYQPQIPPKPQKRSLKDLINRKTETFSELLLRLIDEKGMTDVEVYKRANIDRKLFSKIRKKDYTPKKITVIALAIALRLNMDEARDLLARAGFAFSECNKFDIIIEYFIERESYDIYEINETLFAFEQQLLGV